MELHDEISGFFAQVRDNLDFVALTAALQRNNILIIFTLLQQEILNLLRMRILISH